MTRRMSEASFHLTVGKHERRPVEIRTFPGVSVRPNEVYIPEGYQDGGPSRFLVVRLDQTGDFYVVGEIVEAGSSE